MFTVKCEICHISPKNGPIHAMKRKHIDQILGIKCNYWVWSWPWRRPWIFKVKLWHSRISGIRMVIDIVQKSVIYDHDRDFVVTKMRYKDQPDNEWGNFRCQRAIESSCLKCVSNNKMNGHDFYYQAVILSDKLFLHMNGQMQSAIWAVSCNHHSEIWKNIKNHFARSKISLMEKLAKFALVTPTLGIYLSLYVTEILYCYENN